MDTNKDGVISKDEIKAGKKTTPNNPKAYENHGIMTEEEIDSLITVVDKNNNQEINYSGT